MNLPEEKRDKTFEELKEESDDDWESTFEEYKEDCDDIRRLAEIHAAGRLLTEMFVDGEITLGEYWDLTDYLEEQEADLDRSIL